MIAYGTKVRSVRNLQTGIIVGYGTIQWPTPPNPGIVGDGGVPQPVYLIQLDQEPYASNALGPAAAIWRADLVEEVL